MVCPRLFAESQAAEWDALYADLRALLATYGHEDAVGNGDFWLVDDNYGTPQHKVCVTRISFITRPLCLEIQRAIRKYSLPWEVLLALDLKDARKDPDDFGVTVRKADIEECWNADRVSKAFGSDFKWRLSLAKN